MMTPRIPIGEPFTEGDLRKEVGPGGLHEAVIARARRLFEESGIFFGNYLV
jgi:hypothetical protein